MTLTAAITATLQHNAMKPALSPMIGSCLLTISGIKTNTPVAIPANTPSVLTRLEYSPKKITPGKNWPTPLRSPSGEDRRE